MSNYALFVQLNFWKSQLINKLIDESCSTTWVDPKTVVESYPNPIKSPLGPQKVTNDAKIKQKPIPELMETYKMKVEQLHE